MGSSHGVICINLVKSMAVNEVQMSPEKVTCKSWVADGRSVWGTAAVCSPFFPSLSHFLISILLDRSAVCALAHRFPQTPGQSQAPGSRPVPQRRPLREQHTEGLASPLPHTDQPAPLCVCVAHILISSPGPAYTIFFFFLDSVGKNKKMPLNFCF